MQQREEADHALVGDQGHRDPGVIDDRPTDKFLGVAQCLAIPMQIVDQDRLLGGHEALDRRHTAASMVRPRMSGNADTRVERPDRQDVPVERGDVGGIVRDNPREVLEKHVEQGIDVMHRDDLIGDHQQGFEFVTRLPGLCCGLPELRAGGSELGVGLLQLVRLLHQLFGATGDLLLELALSRLQVGDAVLDQPDDDEAAEGCQRDAKPEGLPPEAAGSLS